MKNEIYCQKCGTRLYKVKWEEPQGEEFDDESYFECPNGCLYPMLEDNELTQSELLERKNENKR